MNKNKQRPATIFIDGLLVSCVIGAYDWERTVRQELRVDLRVVTDIANAARSDSLDDAPVDYAAVAERIQAIAEATTAQLVEHLAERMAEQLLRELPISEIELALTKPTAITNAAGVGVRIHRFAE